VSKKKIGEYEEEMKKKGEDDNEWKLNNESKETRKGRKKRTPRKATKEKIKRHL
jgi:hypothetical protein